MLTSLYMAVLKPTRSAVTIRAIIFVVFVCLSLIIVDGWRSWNAREFELQEMGVATANLAQGMAQHANDTFKLADTVTFGIVERVEHDGTQASALQSLHQFLMNQVTQAQQFYGIYIFNEKGQWLTDSEPKPLNRFDVSDREYFIFHRTHPDLGMRIGAPVVGRFTGKWVMPLSRRINHPDGSFAGLVVIAVDIGYFTKFYDKLDIGRAGSLLLVQNNGTTLLRRPYNFSSLGRSMVGTELFRAFKANGTGGTLWIRSSLDGVMRLNSYRSLDNYPLFADAALSKDEMLADWWSDTLLHTGGVIILVIILALAGVRLIRQIQLRTKTEHELLLAHDALGTLNQTLEKLATLDGLTGLANRRKFDTSLSVEFNRATRYATSLALIMIDVDQFKQYNDIYGHPAGDACLRAISQTTQDLAQNRPDNLVARYGGEELVVLLPDTDLANALLMAEEIRLAIEQLGIEHSGDPTGVVTISVGVEARIPVRGVNTADQLVEAADKALYAAKSAGRNRVCSRVGWQAKTV